MNQFKRLRNRYKTSEYNYNLRSWARWGVITRNLGLVPLSEYPGTLSPLSGELGSYRGIRFMGADFGKGDDVTVLCQYRNGEITNDVSVIAANKDALTNAVENSGRIAVWLQG